MKSRRIFILALVILLIGVSTSLTAQVESTANPIIELTYVPPYGSSDDLEGLVRNVDPADYRVAVYIFVGGAGWWTKPTFANPLTSIQSDSTWTCDITTGGSDIYATKIRAFLVPDGVDAPLAGGEAELPASLDTISVANVHTIRTRKAISFSGYEWWVKASVTRVGPGPNYFSDSTENVWVDEQGLHLKITRRDGRWYCPEVICNESFGYGKYCFCLVGRIGQLDRNAVLGLFTWDDSPEETHREIDIEFSRWGVEEDSNAQYVVQPWDQPGNRHRWMMPEWLDSSAHNLTWESDNISFFSVKGHQCAAPFDSIVHSWVHTGSSVPTPGNETPRINLWLFNGNAPADTAGLEVVITKFEHYSVNAVEDDNGESTIDAPSSFRLCQNYPNPFNPNTTIPYQIPKRSRVNIRIYNILGQQVETLLDEEKNPGWYTVPWNGGNDGGVRVGGGVYFCLLRAEHFVETKRLILLR